MKYSILYKTIKLHFLYKKNKYGFNMMLSKSIFIVVALILH